MYPDAQSRCAAEGGFLAPVTSEDIQTELGAIIQKKMSTLESFQGRRMYWIDGMYQLSSRSWAWNHSLEIFGGYTNWRYGIAGKL